MSCAYHPDQPPISSCQACRRRLCASCDHRIKGLPYCQDCIVAGIERLRATNSRELTTSGMPGESNRRATQAAVPDRQHHSIPVAFIFSLFPGLGAVYNGQNVKALLHFTLIAGAWTLADLFSATLESLFTLVGFAVYLYSIHDACQSARRAKAGIDLALEEEQIRDNLRKRTDLAGLGLILLGGMVVLNSLMPTLFNRFWPVILVPVGVRLVWGWRRQSP